MWQVFKGQVTGVFREVSVQASGRSGEGEQGNNGKDWSKTSKEGGVFGRGSIIGSTLIISLVYHMSSPTNPRPWAEAKFTVFLTDGFVVVGAP